MDRKLVILTHTKETKSRNYEEQPLWGFPLCGRASLKEVPHAHPYLGKLLFHAAVVATFLHPAVLLDDWEDEEDEWEEDWEEDGEDW